MPTLIFFVISAGILLRCSVSKEYKCYLQVEGGTPRRNFSCQTISPGNPSHQTTTFPYSQTTSSYPRCPQILNCTESPFTSDGTTTGSSTTAPTAPDTTGNTTKSMTLTTASTTESTTSSLHSTTQPATPATLTAHLTMETLTTTESQTTSSTTIFLTTTTVSTTSSMPTTTESTTTFPTTTSVLSTLLLSSTIQTSNSGNAPVLAENDQVASVYSCFFLDKFNATEDILCQEIFEDHCITNPCQNGATCISKPYRYSCVCAQGFTDPECMTQINLCENYPCDPFGTCEDFLNGYNCTCKSGFKFVNRTYCEDIDECQLIEAINKITTSTTAITTATSTTATTTASTTSTASSTSSASSTSTASTTSTASSTSSAPATYRPCSNGSQCKNYPGGYECLCQKGKLGKYCEMDDKNELQTVTNINPTFGLLAGGGLLNVTGTNLSLYPPLGAYFTPQNQSLEELYGFAEGNISDVIRIRIPRAPSTGYINEPMSITIKYSNEKNLSVPQKYKYLYTDNPLITYISPDNIMIAAGIKLRLKGQNLNSVNDPKLKVKIIMRDNITSINKTMTCLGLNDSYMVCQLPLIQALEAVINISFSSRNKRNVIPDDAKFSQTNSRSYDSLIKLIKDLLKVDLKNNTNITSVIPYKIYLGLDFDNFPKYSNLTRSYPRYQPELIILPPHIVSPVSPQVYNPKNGESLKIEGEQMNYGVSLEDYAVSIGTGTCQPSHLEETLLECLPPKFRPEPGRLAEIYSCGENLPVMVGLGSLPQYFYTCMYVKSDERVPLIIGLSVGLTGFLILVIIIAWLVCFLIRRNGRLQTDDGEADESSTWNNELRPSYRRMVADVDLDPDVRDIAGGYSTSAHNDRRVTRETNPSDIVSVSQRNRGQARDYFLYGENNPDVALVKKQTYGDFLKAKDRISYTRPNRQFDDVEENQWEPKNYKQVYHNMSFNKLDD